DIEENVKYGLIQKVLGLLLDEKVPVTALEKVFETIADNPGAAPAELAEQVRTRLGPSIVTPYLTNERRLPAVIFDPVTEQRLSQSIAGAQGGGGLGIAPAEASRLMDRIAETAQDAMAQGLDPVLLTTAPLRRHMRQIVGRFLPELPVISYSEIGGSVQVDVLGTVGLEQPQAQGAAP
ncbi:MAG: FHIPEP family type III secretion protein, partial [Planctomycetota bacterium]